MKFFNVGSIELEIKVGAAPSASQKEAVQQPKQIETAVPLKNNKPQTKQIDKEQEITEQDIEIEVENKPPKYETQYNDQVKMVKDLFDAKIFD